MASPRAAQRRTQGPSSLTPQAKPVISVEEWEAKSPLSELQIKSVNSLKRVCEERRLPLKVRPLVLDCICCFFTSGSVQRRRAFFATDYTGYKGSISTRS